MPKHLLFFLSPHLLIGLLFSIGLIYFLYPISINHSSHSTVNPGLVTLIETPPVTLNPRMTLDAIGQRINMLLFRALTRIDSDLNVQPDLASSWKTSADQKKWTFTLKQNLKDHAENKISTSDLKICLENYIQGEPASPLKNSFTQWEKVKLHGPDQIQIFLKKPDPSLLRNLSLLRFFRVEGEKESCKNPHPHQQLITNGPYQMKPWETHPESQIFLQATRPHQLDLTFYVTRDESSRTLKFLKGDIDFLQNSLSPRKTQWLMKNYSDRFRALTRDGVNVSYLAFNLEDPILSQPEVRQAIALSIDRELIIQTLLKGSATIAGSFLSPHITHSYFEKFPYDPKRAELLLDHVGLKKKSDQIRFHLKYKTTPSQEGMEIALVFQEMLKKIGIALDLDVVDPAVFFSSIRKGFFQIYTSRWVGISDSTILERTLLSTHQDNRVHYKNERVDRALLRGSTEDILFVQKQMAKDLPYFPLWHWNNSLMMKKELTGIKEQDLSFSGSFVPLTLIQKPVATNE